MTLQLTQIDNELSGKGVTHQRSGDPSITAAATQEAARAGVTHQRSGDPSMAVKKDFSALRAA